MADTVSLYIDYEEMPRLTTALPADLEPEDIRYLRLDANIVNTNYQRSIANYVDHINIYDYRDWDCPAGDPDGDCQADLNDVTVLAENWLEFDIDPNSP